MGRKILNRKGLRADYDAAERRKQDEEETDQAEEEEDEAEEEEEKEVDEEEEKEPEEEEGADEEAPKKRKPAAKAPKAAKPAKAKSRARTPKIVRLKVVWGVFNNSNQRVATFDYPKRKDANDLAEKLTTDKKVTHFVQPVKEPIEEKKEKEKS
jgi:hypothetical protein